MQEHNMMLPEILVPKALISALLASFYVVAFIISPYWLIPESMTGKFIVLILTIGIGVAWLHFSADALKIRFDARNCFAFAILLAGLIIINYRPITASIPWRGDEDYHLRPVLDIVSLLAGISRRWLLITLGVFILFLYAAWKKSKWAIVIGGLLVTGLIIFFLKDPFLGRGPVFYLRYPFVNYWFYAAVAKVATLMSNPYHEAIYRIVPLFSAAGTAWVFSQNLTPARTPVKILWGLSVALIPILFYYSSILYLELPAVFLMTVVCLHIKSLLEDDFDNIRQNPAWYALILVGFIKETTIPFLFCFLACRIVVSLLRSRQRNALPGRLEFTAVENMKEPLIRSVMGELVIIFATMFPVFLYVLLRSTLASTRSFVPEISALWNGSVYYTIGRSLMEQFGLFLIFFLGGCIVLIVKKEYSTVSFLLLTFFVSPLFHAVDNINFAGYSRFNLFMVPALLAGSNVLIKMMSEHQKIIGVTLAFLAVSVSLSISPIFPDGAKKPLWGNYLQDISEHYYPYSEALSWLKETYGDERILFAGLNYPYYFSFYFYQLDWHPEYKVLDYSDANNEDAALSRILASAEVDNFNIVLYHVLGKDIPQPQETSHFQQEKIIRNNAHLLVVYSKTK